MSDPPSGENKLRRTPMMVVAIAAMLGAFATFGFFGTVENFGGGAPRVPTVSWVVLATLAAVTGALAWVTHQQIHKSSPGAAVHVDPGRAVARLVLGKSALLAGSAFAGGYIMIVALYLPRIAAPLPMERVINGGIAAVFAVALAICGWLLESACVYPPPADSDDAPTDVP